MILKKTVSAFICAVMLLSMAFSAGAAGGAEDISILVNGKKISVDVSPYISESGRTMVPVYFIGTALGADVLWETDGERTVTVKKGDSVILIKAGDAEAEINGEKKTLDSPAEIISNRTFVPLRFISSALGADVEYIEETRTVTIAYDENSFENNDLKSDKYFEKVKALGLINFDEYSELEENKSVTRGAAASVCAKIFYEGVGYETKENTAINDIAPDNPLYAGAMTVTKYGIMTAENGMFNPSAELTEDEALRIIITALGYKDVAEVQGGFPGGYLKFARKLDISADITIGKSISGKRFAKMIFESLTVPTAYKLPKKNGSVYESSDITTLDRLDISSVVGLMSANDKTAIFEQSPLDTDKIKVGDGIYIDKEHIADKFIGAEIELWYKDDDSSIPTALYAEIAYAGCEETVIGADEIIGAEYTAKGAVIIYERGGKRKKALISPTAREIYNLGFSGASDICEHINMLASERSGSVRLLDFTGDGNYDVVYTELYKTYTVKNTVPNEFRINVKDADITYIELDEDKTDYIHTERNGKACAIKDFAENDIIMYYESANGRIVRVYGLASVPGIDTSNKVEGRLNSMEKKEDYAIIELDGLFFETTVDFWRRNRDVLMLGYNYTVYLNGENRVAWMSGSDTGELYGFILGMQADSTIGSPIKIKLLNADDRIVIYEAADNLVLYDGDDAFKIKNNDDIRKRENLYDAENSCIKRQVVKYFINDWGKASKVYIAKPNFAFECVKATEINDDGSMKTSTRSAEYTEDDFILEEYETINPNTTDIYVNLPASSGGRVPVNIAPIAKNSLSNTLTLDWANYDVGRFIKDDKSFGFIKYYEDSGLGRNSPADRSDELKNTPGKVHSLSISAYASIDTRYIASANTVIFRIPGEVGADSNIYSSNTSDEENYRVITTESIPHGSDGRQTSLMQLFDVDENNSVRAMTLIDSASLPNPVKHFTVRGVVSDTPYYSKAEDGNYALTIPIYYRGGYTTLKCASENLTDDGSMLKYFDSDGRPFSPMGIEYFGNGDDRKGTIRGDLVGIYNGKKITELKAGDFAFFETDRDGFVDAFVTLFDGDTSRNYYEDMPSTGGNYFVSKAPPKQNEEKSYPYGNYANHAIEYNQSLNMSPRSFIYGEAMSQAVKINTTYWYAVIKTCLPFWSYRDRVGTNNGSHEMLFRNSEDDTFFELERSREIHNLTDVAIFDSEEKTVTKSSISAIQEGDKLIMIQPQYNSVGQIVIYR